MDTAINLGTSLAIGGSAVSAGGVILTATAGALLFFPSLIIYELTGADILAPILFNDLTYFITEQYAIIGKPILLTGLIATGAGLALKSLASSGAGLLDGSGLFSGFKSGFSNGLIRFLSIIDIFLNDENKTCN